MLVEYTELRAAEAAAAATAAGAPHGAAPTIDDLKALGAGELFRDHPDVGLALLENLVPHVRLCDVHWKRALTRLLANDMAKYDAVIAQYEAWSKSCAKAGGLVDGPDQQSHWTAFVAEFAAQAGAEKAANLNR